MSPWQKLLERPDPHGHLVQFYDRDDSLAVSAGQFLAEGLRRSDGLIIVADAWHRELFRDFLEGGGHNTVEAERKGQLLFLDAQRTLDSFMRSGQPVWSLFETAIGNAMDMVRPVSGSGGLRAFGEMVGILWKAGQFAAAIRLEQLWNRLLGRSSFSLFCGYRMDVFGKDFNNPHVEALFCNHSHVVPGTQAGLEPAVSRAIEEVLGSNARQLNPFRSAARREWAVMPRGEAMVLALRKNLPERADEILERARRIYQACDQSLPGTVM